ncbi:hypothetical protein JXL19_07185, partial [bacterium]|nr:hypothetical protein [bacterium]
GLSGLGLYGLGGLYGLSGLYGMGLYGLGGLYGALSSTYMDLMGMGFLLKSLGLLDSSTNISPTANANALSSLIPLSPLSLTGLPVIPSLPVAGIAGTTLLPLYIAEQTGTWVGNWIAVDSTSTAIVTGRMTLDIAEDLLGGVSGFAVLELNAFLGAGVSLNGSISNNIVILQGSVLTSFGPKPLQVDIICTVDTPAHMTGTYQVADYQGGNVKVYELGTFELQLLPALI